MISSAHCRSAPTRDAGRSLRGGTITWEAAAETASAPKRSTDDIRLGYIKKLEHSRAFIPQLNRPKTSQTVTIFDWDDTLLCTSHLEMVQRQFGAIPSQVRARVPLALSTYINPSMAWPTRQVYTRTAMPCPR